LYGARADAFEIASEVFYFFLYPLLNDAWLAMASSPFSLQLQWKMFAAD
jgi:hypothetical protein